MPAVPWFAFACLLAAYHARVTSLRSLVFSFFSTIPEREQTGHFFPARSSVLITILSKPGSLGKSQSVTTLFNFPASCACWAVRYSYTHKTLPTSTPHAFLCCSPCHFSWLVWILQRIQGHCRTITESRRSLSEPYFFLSTMELLYVWVVNWLVERISWMTDNRRTMNNKRIKVMLISHVVWP